jgi:hypothetical protein
MKKLVPSMLIFFFLSSAQKSEDLFNIINYPSSSWGCWSPLKSAGMKWIFWNPLSHTHTRKNKTTQTNKTKLHSNNGSNWIKSPQWWCSWSSYWPEKAWNLRQQIEQQVSLGTWPSLFSNSLVKSPQSPLLYMVRHANNPAKKLVTTRHQKKTKQQKN